MVIADTAAADQGAVPVVPVLALVGGLVLLVVLWLMLRQRATPELPVVSDEDRADILARLHRHTESLHQPLGDPAAAAPPAPLTPPTAVRLPAIMLLNLPPTAGTADVEHAPPLGPRDEVLARLHEVMTGLQPGPDGRAHHTGPDHSVLVDVGTHDVVHTLVIEATGETGVSMVGWLLDATGWRAFVPKTGRFVDSDALDDLATRDDR